MTSKFMTEPVRILVKRDELTLEVNTNASFASINLVPFWQLHIFMLCF